MSLNKNHKEGAVPHTSHVTGHGEMLPDLAVFYQTLVKGSSSNIDSQETWRSWSASRKSQVPLQVGGNLRLILDGRVLNKKGAL